MVTAVGDTPDVATDTTPAWCVSPSQVSTNSTVFLWVPVHGVEIAFDIILASKRNATIEFCFVLFVLLLYVPSQQLWSWPDGQFTLPHFFLGKLEQTVNQYFVHILSLLTDNNPSWMIQQKGGEWRRNYFKINLRESMGPDRDQTHDPWIYSQTRRCCQTRYRLLRGPVEFCQFRHVVQKHELHEFTMTRTLNKEWGLFEFIDFCVSRMLG